MLFYTLTFKECWDAFEVSKAVFVKSFKQLSFNPILLNKITSYFNETVIAHFLCFEAFQLCHRI